MKTNILAIEDEKDLREFIAEVLEFEGYNCVVAQDGEAGIHLAREFLPDLIICDIMMPQTDGYGVLNALKSNSLTANIPFIFLTAKADRMSLRYGMELGADDYLTKPFKSHELLAAVSTRMQKKASLVNEYSNQVSDLQQSLLSTLPHELRTPLVGIIGNAELLLMDSRVEAQPDITQKLESIFESGKRLHRLIENYLLYAQLEIIKNDAERLKRLRQSRTDSPKSVISEVATAKSNLFERVDNLNLNVVDSQLEISRENLEKIVEEVVDNAFKFSEFGTAINISSKIDGQTYVISISDTGRGMSIDQIKNVGAFVQFGREFYEQQGSGLGLAIAKRLTELHGGEMLIQSETGLGTRVRIKLPIIQSS